MTPRRPLRSALSILPLGVLLALTASCDVSDSSAPAVPATGSFAPRLVMASGAPITPVDSIIFQLVASDGSFEKGDTVSFAAGSIRIPGIPYGVDINVAIEGWSKDTLIWSGTKTILLERGRENSTDLTLLTLTLEYENAFEPVLTERRGKRVEFRESAPLAFDLAALPRGGEIRYTRDGSDPTESSSQYSDGSTVTITQDDTVKARVFHLHVGGAVAEFVFHKLTAQDVPQPQLAAGLALKFADSTTLAFAAPAAGITILFTRNGDDPSIPANAPITYASGSAELGIAESTMIRAVARDASGNYSSVADFAFIDTATARPAKPRILPASGTYDDTATVWMTMPLGASCSGIYYTTDGDPVVRDTDAYFSSPFPMEAWAGTTVKLVAACIEGGVAGDTAMRVYTVKASTTPIGTVEVVGTDWPSSTTAAHEYLEAGGRTFAAADNGVLELKGGRWQALSQGWPFGEVASALAANTTTLYALNYYGICSMPLDGSVWNCTSGKFAAYPALPSGTSGRSQLIIDDEMLLATTTGGIVYATAGLDAMLSGGPFTNQDPPTPLDVRAAAASDPSLLVGVIGMDGYLYGYDAVNGVFWKNPDLARCTSLRTGAWGDSYDAYLGAGQAVLGWSAADNKWVLLGSLPAMAGTIYDIVEAGGTLYAATDKGLFVASAISASAMWSAVPGTEFWVDRLTVVGDHLYLAGGGGVRRLRLGSGPSGN